MPVDAQQSVQRLGAVLSSQPSVNPVLALTAFIEYVEEVLLLIWGPQHASPQLAVGFLERCLFI